MRIDASVSSENMRITSRAASGSRPAADESGTSGSPEKRGVSGNFKAALLKRLEQSQKTGTAAGQTPQEAQALVDSIANTVSKVKDSFGQEAGNAAMNSILKKLDQKGFSLESVTETVGEAVRTAAQLGTSRQRAEFMADLNEDLGADLEGANPDKIKSLSRAINDFFGVEAKPTDNPEKTKVMGFDDRGHWGELEMKAEEKGEEHFLEGTPEAAQEALEGTAAFTVDDIGQETIDDMAAFLRDEMGNEEAARFVEEQSPGAGFLDTVDMAINMVLENSPNRAADAARLEHYLNGSVKSAVNNSDKTNRNLFGNVEFEGWSLQSGAPAEGGGQAEVTVSSKWKYGNRDDVSYTRDNRVKAQNTAEEAAGKKAAEDESPLVQQFKKLAAAAQGGDSGNLVDEEV